MTLSDKIDSVVTNRVLALPIFFIIMTLVYYISVTTVGGWATDWTNDVFFGEIVNDAATSFLASIQAPDWLSGLIVDGIIEALVRFWDLCRRFSLFSSLCPFWKTRDIWLVLPLSWTGFSAVSDFQESPSFRFW